jgi:phage-related tail fiber protein
MSFLGSHEEAKSLGRKFAHVIDDLDGTSPIRDGGSDVGGAPIATSMGGGSTEFTQSRTRTGIQNHEVGTVVRQYGQKHVSKPK